MTPDEIKAEIKSFMKYVILPPSVFDATVTEYKWWQNDFITRNVTEEEIDEAIDGWLRWRKDGN